MVTDRVRWDRLTSGEQQSVGLRGSIKVRHPPAAAARKSDLDR